MRKVSTLAAFSLFELLITLSIIVILLVVIFPSKNLFLKSTAERLSAQQLFAAIQLARQEAMMQGIKVTLCQSRDEKTCGGEWWEGYIIQANQKTLFAFKNRETIYWRAFPKNRSDLQFLPTGMTRSENGTFWHCNQNQVRWAIVVSQSGRARLVWPDKYGLVAVEASC